MNQDITLIYDKTVRYSVHAITKDGVNTMLCRQLFNCSRSKKIIRTLSYLDVQAFADKTPIIRGLLFFMILI